ncbi:hypothetical protein AAY473_006822 [Plecturocebus cupreus]
MGFCHVGWAGLELLTLCDLLTLAFQSVGITGGVVLCSPEGTQPPAGSDLPGAEHGSSEKRAAVSHQQPPHTAAAAGGTGRGPNRVLEKAK